MKTTFPEWVPKSLRFAARLSFSVMVILIPFRLRWTLVSRPNPSVYSDYTDFLLYASDIAMLAVLVFWGSSHLFQAKKISFGPTYIWIPLLGLTLTGWLSVLTSMDRDLTIYHAVRFCLLFALYLFVANEIHSPRWVVIPVAMQMFIQSVVAIAQSLLQHDLGLQVFGEYKLDPLAQRMSVLEAGGVRFLRAYGLSDHPNILGGCLAIGLLVLFTAFLNARRNRIYMPGFVFVISSVALFLTFSRSAWLAFGVGFLVVQLGEMFKKNVASLKRIVIIVSICAVVMTWFIVKDYDYLRGRAGADNSFSNNGIEYRSIYQRVFLFEATYPILRDHLFTGVGLGASVEAMKTYYSIFPMSYEPPHITLLAAALELGLIGSAFYLMLMLSPCVDFIQHQKSFLKLPLIDTAFALLLALIVIGLFDHYPWMLVPGRLLQWTALGLWSASLKLRET